MSEVLRRLRSQFPCVEVYVSEKGGAQVLFLIRSDGEHVLCYNVAGYPYKLPIAQFENMKSLNWEMFMEDGDLSFYNGEHVFTVGPWTYKKPKFVLGSLSAFDPKRRKKVGKGKDAFELRQREQSFDV